MEEKKTTAKSRFEQSKEKSLHIYERWEIDAQNLRVLCSDGKHHPLDECDELRKKGVIL